MVERKIFIANDGGHNYAPAQEHTALPLEKALVPLSKGIVNIFDTDRIQQDMANTLGEKFKEGDLLLLSGSNMLNVIAAVLVLEMFGRVDVLLFNHLAKKYVRREITKEGIKWQLSQLPVESSH